MKFIAKPIINKKNGQINFSVPRRRMSKETIGKIIKGTKLQLRIEKIW